MGKKRHKFFPAPHGEEGKEKEKNPHDSQWHDGNHSGANSRKVSIFAQGSKRWDHVLVEECGGLVQVARSQHTPGGTRKGIARACNSAPGFTMGGESDTKEKNRR